jgi:hypothetical protein
MADDAEGGVSRPSTAAAQKHELEGTSRLSVESYPPSQPKGPGMQHYLEPIPLSEPTLSSQSYQPPPPTPQPQKALPSVASLLNSPVHETNRRGSSWQEPIAPTPLSSAPSNALPLPLPDAEYESRRMCSPSLASEVSRSQSQSDYYNSRQPSVYGMRDDRYYREDPRASIPPRYVQSPQLLPPPRMNEAMHQSSYYQPRSEMPPPAGLQLRESFSRSPVQHRSVPSPLPPPSLPPESRPTYDYYPERRTPDPRYPPFREEYYERDDRGYYAEQASRDRVFEREHIDMRLIANERMERQRIERERESIVRERGREAWNREPYPEYPPRPYQHRERSTERVMYPRAEYDREWTGIERDRIERDRLDRLERDRQERDRLERVGLDRHRLDQERWARR